MKPSDRLQARDPLPDAHRDVWGEAVDVLVEALLGWGCRCAVPPIDDKRNPKRHAGICPYRVTMERLGLG